jgi:cell division protein FtsN
MTNGQRRAQSNVRASRRGDGGGTLVGVFIGLVLGLALAAGVAYYLMRANGPFPSQSGKEAREAPRDPSRAARADPAAVDKPRFDFYKILPGVEEPKVQAEARNRPTGRSWSRPRSRRTRHSPRRRRRSRKKSPRRSHDGCQAAGTVLAAGGLVHRGVRRREPQGAARVRGLAGEHPAGRGAGQGHTLRVRLGPYDNTDELNRIRTDLAKSGFDVAVIKF